MSVETRLDDLEEGLRKIRDADKLQGRRVSAVKPIANELLGWNNDTKKWEPKSSSPAARVYNNANISINNDTATALTFNSERYDTDSIHSTSSNTGRLTCVTAGKYHASCSIRFAAHATGSREVYIRLNGSTAIADFRIPTTSGGVPIIAFGTDYDLAVDDYLEVMVRQNSGGSLNVDAASNYSPEFMMFRLGPRGSASGATGDDHGTLTGLGDDDHSIYLLATGTRAGSSGAAQDFGSTGIKTDTIAESTGGSGVTADGVLLKDGVVTVGDVAFDDGTSDPLQDADAAADGTENSVARKDHKHPKHHAKYTNTEALAAAKAGMLETINFIIDGGGSAITTGVKGDVKVDYAGTIQSWTILPDQSGSIVIDIWKDTYANFPPTDADSMPGGGKEPTLSATTKAQDTDITDWTTDDISAGDILRFNVDSITTCERVTISLKVTRT